MHIVTNASPNSEIADRIVRARVRMIMRLPFFGNVAIRLTPVEISEESYGVIPTAATDGRIMLYNPEFISTLTDEQLIGVIGHEMLHAALYHTEKTRTGNRQSMIWNMACDYVINWMLVGEGNAANACGDISSIDGVLLDEKYAGMSAEQVYDILIEEMPEPTEFDLHIVTGSISAQDKGEGGKVTYKIVPVGQDGAEGDGSSEGDTMLMEELKQAVISAAAMAERQSGGYVPQGIGRRIREWMDSRVDWRTLLATELSDLVRNDWSWTKPNKRSWGTNCIMPSLHNGERISVAIGIDASGSISETDLAKFMSEVKGIMETYQDFEIHVWSYDTAVYNYQVFTQDNLSDIDSYEVTGGGGTAFEASYNFMEENNIHPQQYINFTDGYPGGGWGNPDQVDTIFVIVGSEVVPPFGRYAHYDKLAA